MNSRIMAVALGIITAQEMVALDRVLPITCTPQYTKEEELVIITARAAYSKAYNRSLFGIW